MQNAVRKMNKILSGTNFKVPSPEGLQGMLHRMRFTPDICKLEEYQYQRLFVYDEMMEKGYNHAILGDHGEFPQARKLAHAVYTDDLYVLWKKKLGSLSYPVAMRTASPTRQRLDDNLQPTGSRKRIKGQLFAVRPSRFVNLDIWKENGVQFRRRRVDVLVPYRSVQWNKQEGNMHSLFSVMKVKAWMYIGLKDYWDEFMDDGYLMGICQSYKTKNEVDGPVSIGDYYYYSNKLEIND